LETLSSQDDLPESLQNLIEKHVEKSVEKLFRSISVPTDSRRLPLDTDAEGKEEHIFAVSIIGMVGLIRKF